MNSRRPGDVNATRPACKYYQVKCEEFVRRMGRASRTDRVIYARRMCAMDVKCVYIYIWAKHTSVVIVLARCGWMAGVNRDAYSTFVCVYPPAAVVANILENRGRNTNNVTSGPGVRILHRTRARVCTRVKRVHVVYIYDCEHIYMYIHYTNQPIWDGKKSSLWQWLS